ncbi:MAG: transcriptional repressor LexA [Candidatus Zixiibacteriota bacterium]
MIYSSNPKGELNKIERGVLEFIVRYKNENDIAPTIREIAGTLNMSKSHVPNILRSLQDKQYIEVLDGTPRGIVLKQKNFGKLISIPVIGTIAAGVPVFAAENYEGSFSISSDFVPNGELFALMVSGESMIGANIFDGDVAIIKREEIAQNGDIVAALVDGEATLKRFYRNKDVIWLMPENSDFKPVIITKEEGPLLVLGKLVATIRKY